MKLLSLLVIVFITLSVSSGAQTNTENQFEFYNDGSGQISKLPSDDTFPKIQRAVFKPDSDFYLEPLSDSAFAVIERMPNIEIIEIRCPTDPLTERTAKLISNCRKLKYLTIQNAAISQAAIPVLLEIPLQLLELRCIPISNHLKHLNRINLYNLILRHCGLQNSDAEAIANCPKLQYLDVHGNEYLDTDFILRLGSLKELKVLHITDAQFSVANCHHVIQAFPKLKFLNAETTSEGEAVLTSSLNGFKLLPPYVLGESPMWGLEGNGPLGPSGNDAKNGR